MEKIGHPGDVLQTKEANSLEAALLVAAFKIAAPQRIKSRLCLVALPQPEFYTGLKKFFLSWSIDGQTWFAIDLTEPNKIDFNDNQSSISIKITDLMKSKGYILEALNERGVFIDTRDPIVAIDFYKASLKYEIGGLPQK